MNPEDYDHEKSLGRGTAPPHNHVIISSGLSRGNTDKENKTAESSLCASYLLLNSHQPCKAAAQRCGLCGLQQVNQIRLGRANRFH